MNCKNCGAALSPNSNICNMCGMLVNVEPATMGENVKAESMDLMPNESEIKVETNTEPQGEIVVSEPIVQIDEQNKPVEAPIVEINEPVAPIQNIDNNVQSAPIVENVNNTINNIEVTKKNNDKLFYIILAVLSIAIVASVVYLLFFANK